MDVPGPVDWREHLTSDADVCHGRVRFRGTRIPVSVILYNLAAGVSHDEILRSYPSLSRQSLGAALSYAAYLA